MISGAYPVEKWDPDPTIDLRRFLFGELVHCEHVGGHHDQHRDVEGEERAQQEEMPVRHLASEQRDVSL